MQYNFSKKISKIGPASSIELNEMVYELKNKGKNPIILSYGEAPFNHQNIDFGNIDFDKGAHYSESMGILGFRRKICEYHLTKHNAQINTNNVMVSTGSKIISYIALLTILDENDEILLHEPSWVSYQEHAKLAGASTSFIPFFEKSANFSNYFKEKTRALILNNPNNPSGYLYTEEEIRYLANICLKNNIFLIIDESYSDFVCPPQKFFSGTKLISEGMRNVLVLNSVSKNLGLSGWRIGYLLGSDDFLTQALKINQHLITCAPTILQLYLEKNFNSLMSSVEGQMHNLMLKRKQVDDILKKLDISYLPGSSTFYYFLNLEKYGIDAKEFCINTLKDKNVALIPGNAYGQNLKNFVRISIGIEPINRIEEGLQIMLNQLSKT